MTERRGGTTAAVVVVVVVASGRSVRVIPRSMQRGCQTITVVVTTTTTAHGGW